MVERKVRRFARVVRIGSLILLGFLIFVDVVWTIARVAQGQFPQALLGVTMLAIHCVTTGAIVKAKPS